MAYLKRLATSRRKADRDLYADLLIRLERYCATGRLLVPRELNSLREDLYEFKVGTLRLPFFDVPNSSSGAVRVTHAFTKRSEKCPRSEIDQALWVKREDAKQ